MNTTNEPLTWDEADEAVPRCRLKPEHVRPFLRALKKEFPRADFCAKEQAIVKGILDECGLPPYKLLKKSGAL